MSLLYFFSIFCFLFFCVIFCFLILIQEGKGGGLGASFGSADASDTLFGTSTPEVLKKITAWAAAIFIGGCLILSLWTQSLARSKTTTYEQPEQNQVEIEQ
jgi:preprotein translocase subunit SecG